MPGGILQRVVAEGLRGDLPVAASVDHAAPPQQCPVDHASPPQQCPVEHAAPPQQCPVDHAVPPQQCPVDHAAPPQQEPALDVPAKSSGSKLTTAQVTKCG